MKGESTDAHGGGGSSRSSVEPLVMRGERRRWISSRKVFANWETGRSIRLSASLLATIQLDPHPTTAGHAAIDQALLDAESGQTPASYYTVGIGTLTGGTITASPIVATSGSAINLTITPNAGMQLQAGSLKYNDGSDHIMTGTSFIMPDTIVKLIQQELGKLSLSINVVTPQQVTSPPQPDPVSDTPTGVAS